MKTSTLRGTHVSVNALHPLLVSIPKIFLRSALGFEKPI